MKHVLTYRLDQAPVLSNWQALLDHLSAATAHASRESFRILHLDTLNQLIRDELYSEGTINSSAVYVREVVGRALDYGSTALILVHNHPSGNTTPSRADIDLTRAVAAAAKLFGIAVYDHLIIGRDGHTSLRTEGHI